MSVTFFATGTDRSMNLANGNALDLMVWVGIAVDEYNLYGDIPARELAALCRRRLWPEERNFDPEILDRSEKGMRGATLVFCGRPAGYLRSRTEQLLVIAERALETVQWE